MRTASRVNACKRRVSSLSKRAMYIIRVDDLSLSRLILHGSRSRVTVQHPPSPPHPMCRVSVPPSSGRRLEKDWTNFIAAKAAPSLPPSPHSSAARSAARPDLGPCVAQPQRWQNAAFFSTWEKYEVSRGAVYDPERARRKNDKRETMLL